MSNITSLFDEMRQCPMCHSWVPADQSPGGYPGKRSDDAPCNKCDLKSAYEEILALAETFEGGPHAAT
jgi:hypothetical protein